MPSLKKLRHSSMGVITQLDTNTSGINHSKGDSRSLKKKKRWGGAGASYSVACGFLFVEPNRSGCVDPTHGCMVRNRTKANGHLDGVVAHRAVVLQPKVEYPPVIIFKTVPQSNSNSICSTGQIPRDSWQRKGDEGQRVDVRVARPSDVGRAGTLFF